MIYSAMVGVPVLLGRGMGIPSFWSLVCFAVFTRWATRKRGSLPRLLMINQRGTMRPVSGDLIRSGDRSQDYIMSFYASSLTEILLHLPWEQWLYRDQEILVLLQPF